MIWWYKEIFISRSFNSDIEQRSVRPKKRLSTIAKGFTKLKTVFKPVIEYQREAGLKRHSYRSLSQLDDRYLADIGLFNEDLYLLRKGLTPQRFEYSEMAAPKSVGIRLISSGSAGVQHPVKQHAEADKLDKAA